MEVKMRQELNASRMHPLLFCRYLFKLAFYCEIRHLTGDAITFYKHCYSKLASEQVQVSFVVLILVSSKFWLRLLFKISLKLFPLQHWWTSNWWNFIWPLHLGFNVTMLWSSLTNMCTTGVRGRWRARLSSGLSTMHGWPISIEFTVTYSPNHQTVSESTGRLRFTI